MHEPGRWVAIIAVCICFAYTFASGGIIFAMTHFDHGDVESALAGFLLAIAGAAVGLIVAVGAIRQLSRFEPIRPARLRDQKRSADE